MVIKDKIQTDNFINVMMFGGLIYRACLGKRNNIPYALENSKLETNVKVVPRKKHVYRVSEIEGTNQLTKEIRWAALDPRSKISR